jgi:tetratricopeptide (TPR) repeat protein
MAEPIAIAVWEPDEAADFLIKRTGSKDREAAKKLGEELGFLPLALEQAGAYIEATGCSFAEYLELFRVHRQALLEKGKPATDYPDTVATTWEISFRKLEETTPLAADLMIICAFLAPNDIPFDIFSEAAEKLPEPMQEKVNDPLEFKNALAALRRFSLAEVGQDALSVHRLVQMVARDRMGENGQKEWAGIALRLIDAVYKFEEHDLNTWKRAERLLTHGMTAVEVEYDVLKTEAQKAMSSLCNEIGLHLQTFGGFDEAGRQLERALVIDEKTYGPDHPNVATSLSNLGLVLKDLGDLEGAKVRIERALAMYRKFFGEDHPKTQLVLENLKVLGPAR